MFFQDIIQILSFFVIGVGVKYVDAAFDDDTFSRRLATVASPFLGAVLGLTIAASHPLFIISFSIIFAVFITGKLDILPFRILVALATAVSIFLLHGQLNVHSGDLYVFAAFMTSAALDEIGNDLADAGILRGIFAFFFLNRGLLKLVALILLSSGYIDMITALAFLSFDLGYFAISRLSLVRMRNLAPVLTQSHPSDQ